MVESPQPSRWLWSRGDGITYQGMNIVKSPDHNALSSSPSVSKSTTNSRPNPSASTSTTTPSTSSNTNIKRSSIKGKNAGKGLPGGKAQVRAALIAEKRAARAQRSGDFDPESLVTTLINYITTLLETANIMTETNTVNSTTPIITTDISPQETESLSDDHTTITNIYPIKFEYHHFTRTARDFTRDISKLLYYQYNEIGNKDKRTVILYKYKDQFPTEEEKQKAYTLAISMINEGHGQGVINVIELQKEVKQSRKDKRAHDKQHHKGSTQKMRQLFVNEEDSSSDSTSSSSESIAPTITDSQPSEIQSSTMSTTTIPKKTMVFKPFVKATNIEPVALEKNVSNDPDAAVPIKQNISVFKPQQISNNDSTSESDTFSSSSSSSNDSDIDENLNDATLEQDLIDSFDRLGLGCRNSIEIPNNDTDDTIITAETTNTNTPIYQGTWENHTRGIGSKLLYRMGYAGGKLGRSSRMTKASNNLGPSSSTTPSSTTTVQGYMPEPLEGEFRKARLGIGAYNI